MDTTSKVGAQGSTANRHLEFIDVLRGLAIFGVVVLHVSREIPLFPRSWATLADAGGTGVKLFFAASAFTLFMSLDHRRTEPHRLELFFLRRFLRIAPMYILGMIMYAALGWARGRAYATGSGFDVFLNLVLLHGLFPSAYFGLVPGGWSIGVEVLFYLMLPALMGIISKARYLVLAWIVAVGVAAAWHASYAYWEKLYDPFYARQLVKLWLPNQLPIFIAGAAAYWCVREASPILSWLRRSPAAGYAIVFGLLVIGKALEPVGEFWAPLFLAPPFCLLILVTSVTVPLWIRRIFAPLGILSFSIYVLHFAFVSLLVRPVSTFLEATGLRGSPLAALQFAVSLTLVLGLSALAARVTWRYVENPMIDVGRRYARRRIAGPSKSCATVAAASEATTVSSK